MKFLALSNLGVAHTTEILKTQDSIGLYSTEGTEAKHKGVFTYYILVSRTRNTLGGVVKVHSEHLPLTLVAAAE